MRRRDFITGIAGIVIAATCADAQQPRVIGVLMNRGASSEDGQQEVAAFREAMGQFGWDEGQTIRIEVRWGADDPELERRYAAELMALAPAAVLASGTESATAVQHLSRAVPIVFVSVTDPLGAGLVDSLAHPGGNTTGFMLFEYSFGGKLLELLKQVVPELRRVAVVRDPANPAGMAQFGAIQAMAQSLRIEVSAISVGDAEATEKSFAAFAATPKGGVVVTGSATARQSELLLALPARYRLPAIYATPSEVAHGGLMSYGPDRVDQFRRAAAYIDRVLKGEKPSDLPVQAPAKYEMAINLKTAKALGLTIPQSLLAQADEVIE